MEPLVAIVGFLGAGKTTLLKKLISQFTKEDWQPYVILNDYENAQLDVQQLYDCGDPKMIKALDGSCICCSGIVELRNFINNVPKREKGITFIEANGTSDSVKLMGFLGVGIEDRFAPPIQVSVVDLKNWQKRGIDNELERNQIQVSSLIVLTHGDQVSKERVNQIRQDILHWNASAKILNVEEVQIELLETLRPIQNEVTAMEHHKAHWASCSIPLTKLPNLESIWKLMNGIPSNILRVKGCVQIENEEGYLFFERTPDGEIYTNTNYSEPSTGAALLCIGPGSSKEMLKAALAAAL